MLSRRHAFLSWTSFIVVILITFTDTSNGSKPLLHPQARSSISSPAKYLTNVNHGPPKLLKINQSASNGPHRKTLGAINTMNQEAKTSTTKHNFEKQKMLTGVSIRKITPSIITIQDEKSTTAKQSIEMKVGLAARKNHIQINLNRNINQARRNVQKSKLNTQIQIISNYNPKSRNTVNARTNNVQNHTPSAKRLTTARPRQDIMNSGLNTEGAVMNHNLPEMVHMSANGRHAFNSDPNKISNYDANMLDYKKVTDAKIKIRKHQAIISNAVRLDKIVPISYTQSKKPSLKPLSTSRNPDLGIIRSTPINIAGADPSASGGFTFYSRSTDPLHAFFPDYGNQQSSTSTSSPPNNMNTTEEPLNKTEMMNFRGKMKQAVTLNDNKDIPPFLFRCLPSEVIDCESDENFNYVVESLLQKPESLKDDLDLMQKIYTRLQQVNITWPEGYVFNKMEFANLANDSMVATDVKTRPQSDELSVVKKYKFVREIFSTIAAAPHKPGDIFITDVVREIIKIKSIFVKRKILDLLFYKILNPGYVDETDTANDHDDDVSEVPHNITDDEAKDITDTPNINKDEANADDEDNE